MYIVMHASLDTGSIQDTVGQLLHVLVLLCRNLRFRSYKNNYYELNVVYCHVQNAKFSKLQN